MLLLLLLLLLVVASRIVSACASALQVLAPARILIPIELASFSIWVQVKNHYMPV